MPDVIIVGAGIAGIKAALTLQRHNVSYVILEAQKRLGGRLKTVEGKHGKYDLGASWFHETLNNPLFDEENTVDDGLGPKWFFDDAPIRVVDEQGDVSPLLKLDAIAEEMEKYVELKNYEDLEKDVPYYDNLMRYLKEKKHLLSDEQITRALEQVRRIELWHGIDCKRLSSKYAAMEHEGRDALALNYDRMLKRHTDQLEMDNVILNAPVKSLEKANNKSNVKVTTRDGHVYEAKYAIVTMPQSILQVPESDSGHISFTPPLPSRIREALEKVHFSALGKVVLEFDEVFWPAEHERVLALATPPPGFLDSIIKDTDVALNDSTIPQTWEYPVLALNFATSFKKPSLVILTQSPLTDYLEANPDKAWDYIKPIISKIAMKDDIPAPTNVIVTDWTLNEYQRGSYSACFPGDDPLTAIMALEQGYGNIRFSGEHTILEGAGCVHGAWKSGIREAKYIIEDMKK